MSFEPKLYCSKHDNLSLDKNLSDATPWFLQCTIVQNLKKLKHFDAARAPAPARQHFFLRHIMLSALLIFITF
jgi:hypothetical protein